MLFPRSKALIAVALLAAGCSALPPTGPGPAAPPAPEAALPAVATGDAVAVEDAATGGYRLLGATAPWLALGAPAASSTRNAWFVASHVTDGNTHTAWAPAKGDAAPTLSFDLAAMTRLHALSIKASGGCTVDVAVQGASGWTTVATGLAPVAGTFVRFALPATAIGGKVRLTFRGASVADLLVCGVDLCGAPTTTPSAAPSVVPSAAPSWLPSWLPSLPPTLPPSVAPSVLPSVAPSVLPSVVPSVSASLLPSTVPSVPPSTPPDCGCDAVGSGTLLVGAEIGSYVLDVHETAALDGTATGSLTITTPTGGTQAYFFQNISCSATGFTASGTLAPGGFPFASWGVTVGTGPIGMKTLTATATMFSPFSSTTVSGIVGGDLTWGDPCEVPSPEPSFLPPSLPPIFLPF